MSYICNVFFIVLDLRLTRLVYGGTPFFLPFSWVFLIILLLLPSSCNNYESIIHFND